MDRSPHRGVGGGILTVADIVSKHRHAVVRDLNSLGYKGRNALIDMDEFVSIVLASPPASAVRYAVEGGWSQTDHLLANWAEQQAGLTELPHRYTRPGIDEQHADTGPGPVTLDGKANWTAQSLDEFRARRDRDMKNAAALAESERSLIANVNSRKAEEVKSSA